MTHVIKIEKFEGPLHVLLQIIEAEELDISEVSLAQVTDQYVAYIKSTELPPEEIADFLNIAARLLLIKSRLLLPFDKDLEEDEDFDLAEQLKFYSQYVEAGKVINKLWKKKNNMYARARLVYKSEGFNPPRKLTSAQLVEVLQEVVKRLKPFISLPEQTIRRVISLKEKIQHLVGVLRDKVSFQFHEVLSKNSDNTEVIVSFLALLELVKQREIMVEQSDTFSNINVKRLENNI